MATAVVSSRVSGPFLLDQTAAVNNQAGGYFHPETPARCGGSGVREPQLRTLRSGYLREILTNLRNYWDKEEADAEQNGFAGPRLLDSDGDEVKLEPVSSEREEQTLLDSSNGGTPKAQLVTKVCSATSNISGFNIGWDIQAIDFSFGGPDVKPAERNANYGTKIQIGSSSHPQDDEHERLCAVQENTFFTEWAIQLMDLKFSF